MVMRTLRKKVSLIVWMSGILLVALVVGLVAPGMMGRKDLANAVAVIDGEPVDNEAFSRELTSNLEQARVQQGGDLSEADSNRVRKETLNGLIDEQLAFSHAKSVGQTMSPEEFQKELLNDPSLKDAQGRFDQNRYSRILEMQAEQGISWQEAEQNFQRGMLLGKVRGFWACQVVLSPSETADAKARFNRQVKARVAVWNLEKLRAKIQISDEDLHTFYSENKQKWAKPDQVKLRQILMRTDFASTSAAAKAKVDQVLAKLKGGTDFKAMAATANADENARKNSGDLGWVAREDIRQAELADAAFRLKKGQISDVISTPDGFYILKVEDTKTGFEPTFTNSKDKAAKDLGTQRAGKQASQLAYQTLTLLKQGKTLDEAAKATQADVVTTGWFDRDDSKALPQLGDSPAFARQVLNLSNGDPLPDPVSSEKAVVVAVLSDERPGAAPSKPEAAEARERAALAQARSTRAQALYDAWLAQLRKSAVIVDPNGYLAAK